MAFAKGSRFPKKDEDTSKKTTKKDETTEKEKVGSF